NRTGGFLRSPFVYTLSISVYCTSWTFYGSVGTAARNGLEYLTTYLGPTIVFVGWWFILRRLVRISHDQRITSIADLLSSRFGKSSTLAVLITVLAVIAIAPYIALQLKAVTSSIETIAGSSEFGRGSLEGWDEVGLAFGVAACMALFTILFATRTAAAPRPAMHLTAVTPSIQPIGGSSEFRRGSLEGWDEVGLAFGVAACMALFTILFGTRNVDAKEQHHGVVAAIAFEAIVKLAAFLAVGFFVVYIGRGMETIFAGAAA